MSNKDKQSKGVNTEKSVHRNSVSGQYVRRSPRDGGITKGGAMSPARPAAFLDIRSPKSTPPKAKK